MTQKELNFHVLLFFVNEELRLCNNRAYACTGQSKSVIFYFFLLKWRASNKFVKMKCLYCPNRVLKSTIMAPMLTQIAQSFWHIQQFVCFSVFVLTKEMPEAFKKVQTIFVCLFKVFCRMPLMPCLFCALVLLQIWHVLWY